MTVKPASFDEYFTAAGQILQAAASADTLLFSAFTILSQCPSPLNRAVYYSIESLNARKTLVQRTVEVRKDRDELMDIAMEIARQAQTAAKKRNEIAHAMIVTDRSEGVDPKSPDPSLIRYNPRNLDQSSQKPVTKAYLNSMVNDTCAAVTKAKDAYHLLCEKLEVPPTLSH